MIFATGNDCPTTCRKCKYLNPERFGCCIFFNPNLPNQYLQTRHFEVEDKKNPLCPIKSADHLVQLMKGEQLRVPKQDDFLTRLHPSTPAKTYNSGIDTCISILKGAAI